MSSRIIHIRQEAPPKPAPGQPCNGCGVCCLYEPCPLGSVLSRRRSGACAAVHWDAALARYRCGALTQKGAVLRAALPPGGRWLAPGLACLLRRFAARWIAAGQGCDCELVVDGGGPAPQSDRQSAS
jgi:hypothetical protein